MCVCDDDNDECGDFVGHVGDEGIMVVVKILMLSRVVTEAEAVQRFGGFNCDGHFKSEFETVKLIHIASVL